jgi:predicted Ser/Thr protein kinase
MTPQAIAHYRVTAKLGEGGMGEVYRATDTKLGRDVAIKILPDAFAHNPERMARFAREAQVLPSLNHPNIATIYGVEERAIVMELVEGERLAGPLPLKTALDYARQIAEALEYAHDRGVVHRDLKPANIKVTSEGRVKVLDFGLAKALTSDVPVTSSESSPTLTMRKSTSGVILGTAAYMSPEQAKGKTVDRRADIWAFGVVLMEMLTGRPMYTGETVSETLASVIKDQPDFGGTPRETLIPIRRLLRRCLDKDPHRRLRDIGEARIAIEEALEGRTAEGESAAAPSPRRAFPWGVATVLAIALAVLAIVHFREFRGEPAVVRFTIAPPEKTAFNIMGPAVISRDGSRIAFSPTSADGMSRLWIRSLDAVNARPLAGTEGATFPFWSPDGASLGFFAGGKLKKVDLSGGRVAAICDAYTGVGGTWNQDGVILFAPAGQAALQRVSASGGMPSNVTKLETSLTSHRWPWFLPDGRHFLYLSRTGSISSIRIGSLGSSEDKTLFKNQFNAAYAQGYLLFLSDSILMAQPFDANRLAITGDAVPAVEEVQANSGWQRAVFSVSENGLLIVGTGKSVGAQLAWFDRRGTQLGFLGNPGEVNETEFLPGPEAHRGCHYRSCYTQQRHLGL